MSDHRQHLQVMQTGRYFALPEGATEGVREPQPSAFANLEVLQGYSPLFSS
jgi:hypothetical protein